MPIHSGAAARRERRLGRAGAAGALAAITVTTLATGIARAVEQPGASSQPVVLFDAGHGQRFAIAREGTLDLSALAAVLRHEGLAVRSTDVPLTDAALVGVDALVIAGAFAPLAPRETEAVLRFVARGGRLSVMLHVAPPMAPFLARLGVTTSNGVIRERRNVIDGQPLHFRVTALDPHPLTRDLAGFAVHGSWALLAESPHAAVVARTTSWSWVDLNGDGRLGGGDARQAFGVLVAGRYGRGELAVFGDDALFQNAFLRDENARLARNLARWLRSAGAARAVSAAAGPRAAP